MNDFKSKLPDLNEISTMANKLFKGLKRTIDEIVQDYKEKRAEDEVAEHQMYPRKERLRLKRHRQ